MSRVIRSIYLEIVVYSGFKCGLLGYTEVDLLGFLLG